MKKYGINLQFEKFFDIMQSVGSKFEFYKIKMLKLTLTIMQNHETVLFQENDFEKNLLQINLYV